MLRMSAGQYLPIAGDKATLTCRERSGYCQSWIAVVVIRSISVQDRYRRVQAILDREPRFVVWLIGQNTRRRKGKLDHWNTYCEGPASPSGLFGKFGNTDRSHSHHGCIKKFDVGPCYA